MGGREGKEWKGSKKYISNRREREGSLSASIASDGICIYMYNIYSGILYEYLCMCANALYRGEEEKGDARKEKQRHTSETIVECAI